jgi:5-hydroxyisourate hydrolase-like protein (transthyretin family)
MNRRFCWLGLGVVLLVGCGGGGSNAPTTANNAATTTVTVDYAGSPLAGIKVTLSTGLNNQTPTGVISTGTTNSQGQVTFSLPATGTLCVSATETTNAGNTFAGNCEPQPFPASFGLALDS